jgi:hypothetical protein
VIPNTVALGRHSHDVGPDADADAGSDRPASAGTLAVTRWLLVGYLCWKVASFPWGILAAWPVHATTAYTGFTPPWLLTHAPLVAGLACLSLLAFAVGYRPRVTAFAAVVTLTFLGISLALVTGNGGTKSLFLATLVVAVFAVCDDRQGRSTGALARSVVDRLPSPRRSPASTGGRPTTTLGPDPNMGAGPGTTTGPTSAPRPLQFTLLAVAILYFGAGVGKVVDGPLVAWTTARSMGAYLLYADAVFTPTSVVPWAAPLVAALLATPLLLTTIAWVTILLEVAFFPAVVARLPIWPFVVGLVGMHAAIAVTMGPFFVDQLVFLALLVDWARVSRSVTGVVRSTRRRVRVPADGSGHGPELDD